MKEIYKDLLIWGGITASIIATLLLGNFVFGADTAEHDVVFCGASWCSGCQKMKPVIKQVEALGYDVYHAKKSEWNSYKVRHIPTTIIYQNGKEVKRFVGYASFQKMDKYLPKKKAAYYDIGFFGKPYDPDSIRMEKRMQELLGEGYSVHSAPQDKLHIYNIRRFPTTIIFLNGYEVKRFEGLVSKAEIRAYLSGRVDIRKADYSTKKSVKIVLAGYDDHRLTISVIGRVLAKEGVQLVHLERKDYSRYGVTTTPTIIFYENGVEKYRLCISS